MSDHDQQKQKQAEAQNKTSPSVGGTSTPIAGSRDGVGEPDPVVSGEAEGSDDGQQAASGAGQRRQ